MKQAKKGFFLTGLALNYLTTELNGFLRPEVFQDKLFDDPYAGGDDGTLVATRGENEAGKPFTYRDAFLQLYPCLLYTSPRRTLREALSALPGR